MGFDTNVDMILAYHGAPTFLGLKPASLISFNKKKIKNLKKILLDYKLCLECKGIKFFTLSETKDWLLLLVYRKNAIDSIFFDEEKKNFLNEFGYGNCKTPLSYLRNLKARMIIKKGFPHEIGIFLGYPLADVKGFIENNGKNFKLAGLWKVYADEKKAEELFSQYTMCTNTFCKHIISGKKIHELATAI